MKRIKPAIVNGIISVANHKLQHEGLESYREYLAKPYYFESHLEEVRKKTREEIIESLRWLLEDKTCPDNEKLPQWVRFHVKEMIEDTKYNANCDLGVQEKKE